jgi:hypothetical protein
VTRKKGLSAAGWFYGQPGFHARMAERAREHAVTQEEGMPTGRAGYVVDEDLEATQHRVKTGLPALPMSCWRW